MSHGSPGTIYLGNSQLSLDTLSQYRTQLEAWNASKILLYGCNVASGDAGTELLTKLHKITRANIAATKTLTGNSKLGGNWDLEVRLGEIQSRSALAPETRRLYTGVLTTYTVNTLQDENDGISAGNVSLRDAIAAANDNPGADTIVFNPALANGGIYLDEGLGISDHLTIRGDGTIRISGRNIHRPFTIDGNGLLNVTFEQLQIVNGRTNYGGGVYNEENLTIIDSTIADNYAGSQGGGIYNEGVLTLIRTNISNNNIGSGRGGGIASYGNFLIVDSTISDNRSNYIAGGISYSDQALG